MILDEIGRGTSAYDGGTLETTSGRAVKLDPHAAERAMLFLESSPLLKELKALDVNFLPY